MSRKFFSRNFFAALYSQSRTLTLHSQNLFREMLLRDLLRKFFVAKVFSYTVIELLLEREFSQVIQRESDTPFQVPSAVLNLSWDGAGPQSGLPYLDPGLLEKIQKL